VSGASTTGTLPLHVRAGSAAAAGCSLHVTPARAGWEFSGLRIVDLPAEGSVVIDTQDDEVIVLPLAGSCQLSCDDQQFELRGRESVFAAVSDFVYAPRECRVEIHSSEGGRFALPAARAGRRLAPRYGPADEVSVELRGAGSASRQVNNFCSPDAFEADRLIAVEVLTPGGNWSSYPPHKHDEAAEGESALEEIYYFEVADGPAGPGMAYHRVYGTENRPISVLAEVRTGDVVLIPHGWHGPSMAVPGYHLYYLNVMAGPGPERAWLIRDDPAHGWVRQTWASQEVDPRLPFGSDR
jgi:5-deoxy-glucuronate isomerase